MKKTFLISFVLLLAGLLFSTQAQAQGRIELRRTNSEQQCSNVTTDGFTATFSFSSIESAKVSTEKGVFSSISMENTYPTGHAGEPSLPAANQLIAIPYGATNVTVNVKNYSTSTYKLSDYNIGTLYPQQPSVRKDQKPEDVKFIYNEQAYASKAYSNRPIAELNVQGTLRGIQVASLTINPVSYNPSENTIQVYNDIEVEVSYGQYDKSAAQNEFDRTASVYFKGIYNAMFNWRDDVYSQHPDIWNGEQPVKMLVITHRDFQSTIQDWVNWKITKGIHMDVHYTDESAVGTTASSIKSFIQSKYQSDAPTFLVIIGDIDKVPASATGSSTQCVTDLYYESVDGDYFPDMLHSRMPGSVTEVGNMLEKMLVYEQYTMSDPSYLNNVLLIAGWDSGWNPKVGKPTIQYAANYYYNQAHGFDNVYQFLTTPYNSTYASLNTGVGFVNYTAHGSNTSWADPSLTVSDVNSLTNTGKYFLAMGNCCQAADWGISGACFGEAMIRASKKAAYTYIGSCPSTYWWEDYYFGVGATSVTNQMPTQDQTSLGTYDAVWMDDAFNTTAAIPFFGNIAVCYAHAGSYETSSSPTYYWQAYHTLGDASIMPFRVQPTANNISHMEIVPIGLDHYEVSAAPGSFVALTKDGVIHGTGLVGSTGTLNLAIDPITSGGEATLCVTHPQRIPSVETLTAAALDGAYITVDSYTPTTAMVGEQTDMTITFKNVGTEATNGTTAVTLGCDDSNFVITGGSYTFSNLSAGATTTVNGFQYQIAEGVMDGTQFQVNYTATCGGETWEGRINVTASAPNLVITDFTTTELMPGQSGTLSFTITNNGSAAAQNAQFQVSCNAPGVGLTNNTFNIGTLAVGASTTKTVNISIASSVSYGTSFNLNYTLTATHFSATGTQGIVAGIITEDFETGGFDQVEWEFAGDADWTIVSDEHYAGNHSAKSGTITHSQQSDLSVNVTVLSAGNISFYYKVSSESNYDKLHFYIDDAEQGVWSGTVAWTQASYAVTPGEHTFRWSYTKDVSVNSGSDCAWIDEVEFPPISVPSAGLTGDVNLDGVVSIDDVSVLLSHLLGNITLTGQELINSDVNGDGVVSIDDVSTLLYMSMNK